MYTKCVANKIKIKMNKMRASSKKLNQTKRMNERVSERMNGLSNKLDVCNVCVLQLDVQYSFKIVFVCVCVCMSVACRYAIIL